MTLDINERRKRLRAALAGADTNDVSGFVAAFAGASEEDRATLARTLPAAKLFKAEGPTPRACFVLAALGKPAGIVEAVRPRWIETNRSFQRDEAHAELLRKAAPVMEEFFLAAAHNRDQAWQLTFIDALPEAWELADRMWSIARALITAHALAPESEVYLRWFLDHIRWDGKEKCERSGAEIAALLTESNGALLTEFWALFRFEGMGTGNTGDVWHAAIAILCDTVPGFRDRILDGSLGALLRDFSANNAIWYHRVHRALDPTPEEIAARAGTYESLLAAGPSTTVGLAQDMLARAIDRIDPDGLLDASAGVLGRSEKKLLTGQLKLLSALVKTRPERAAQVSKLVAGIVEAVPADVAMTARKLILPDQDKVSTSGAADSAAPTGVSVTVPEPRREVIPHESDRLIPVANEDELWKLVSACLEGVGHGRDLPRILDYLSRRHYLAGWGFRVHATGVGQHQQFHQDHSAQPLLARAAEVMASVWDWKDASPRRHLADLLLHKRPRQITYRGYQRILYLKLDELAPEGVAIDEETNSIPTSNKDGTWTEVEKQRLRYSRVSALTEVPTALLVEQFNAGVGQVTLAPLPAAVREWERAMLPPGKGYYGDGVLGINAKPVWLPAGQTPSATLKGRDLGVGAARHEYTLRAEEAREQDGFDQIVQWAAWLLSENPDTLAVIYHPVLNAAISVVNVRGVGVLLAALGETRRVPHGPVWSALALGLSAKMPEHRATAAEAVAALAESGLLDPAPFAAEIAAHLKDELVLAGRLATALADAASINPIAGYRVLQTLAALLPHLDGVNQAAKLVELTARLAADYGTPAAVPDALASKRKGSSVMAVALRALDAVTPRATPLAEEAAAQAAASLADPGGREGADDEARGAAQ